MGILFNNRKQSPEELMAEAVLTTSERNANAIYNAPLVINKEKVQELGLELATLELSFFSVHLLSRELLDTYGAKKRYAVINSVLTQVQAGFISAISKGRSSGEIKALAELFPRLYQEAETAYGGCTSYHDEKSSIAGRMEGAAKCTAIATCLTDRMHKAFTGEEFATDIYFIAYFSKYVSETRKAFDFPKLVSIFR